MIRAAAQTVLPPDSAPDDAGPGLFPLALVLMGAPVLDADRATRLLGLVEPWRPASDWPTDDEVAAFRRMAPALGVRRVAGLLGDAATRAEGPSLLRHVLVELPMVWHQLPSRLPNRLLELRDLARSLLTPPPDSRPQWEVVRPTAATPATTATPTDVIAAAPPPPARRQRPETARALAPPPTRGVAPGRDTAIRYAAQTLALHGTAVGPLRLTLPRTPGELEEWGRRLHNCIGSFGPAAATGQTSLIGIELDDRLVYCAEVTPAGVLRQLLGDRNRAAPASVTVPVWRYLVDAGVIAPSHRGNAAWRALLPAPDGRH